MPQACNRCGTVAGTIAGSLCPACLLRLATRPESRVPEFEIETLLGSGTGTTYLARAAGGTLLAIKDLGVMSASTSLDALDALTERLTAVRHASLAPLLAIDVDDDGRVRMIRDYVVGRASSDWPDTGAVAAAAADVEAHLRGLGLEHGNLTPSNIVIAREGRPMILDAGAAAIAKLIRGEAAD